MCLGFARKIYGIRLTEYQFPVSSTKPENRSQMGVTRSTSGREPTNAARELVRQVVVLQAHPLGSRCAASSSLPAETPKVEFVCM